MTSTTRSPSARPGPVRLAVTFARLIVITGVLLLAAVPAGAAASSSTVSGTLTGAAAQAIPNSATGCNGSVCIHVQGTGLFVNYVTASGVTKSQSGCSFGEFLVRGSVREVTNPVCWNNQPGSLESLFAYFPVGYNINDGSQVCVKFSGKGSPSGEPCETIHS